MKRIYYRKINLSSYVDIVVRPFSIVQKLLKRELFVAKDIYIYVSLLPVNINASL